MQSQSLHQNNLLKPGGRRRGHVQQISISDDNHHVTEAIGDMYGDNDWIRANSRPTSFVGTPPDESQEQGGSYFESSSASPPDSPLTTSLSSERHISSTNGILQDKRVAQSRRSSSGDAISPTTMTRSPSSSTASQHFPLNDIDYESSPAAVAQELSNLQAIRRMSMNVDAADPDLPSFTPNFGVPAVAPPHSADENDTSRLFWVPARLHPELAPKEFKTFVEDRVDRIRRQSGEDARLSPGSLERHSSGSSLNRRKSMLSRTIESPIGYEDGAERLERKKSKSHNSGDTSPETTLQELETLVNDPVNLVRKMSIDSARRSLDANSGDQENQDMPILPSAPGGSLKRSTRTNYRRGSLRKGERLPPSRRAASRVVDGETEMTASSKASETTQADLGLGSIKRVQTEPVGSLAGNENGLSRSSQQAPSGRAVHSTTSLEDMRAAENPLEHPESERQPHPKSFQSRIANSGRTTATLPGYGQQFNIPQINETSVPDGRIASQSLVHPERKSSHDYTRTMSIPGNFPESSPLRPNNGSVSRQQKSSNQTLDDMANNPSPMPGTSTRTDSLSFIPTFADEKKSDRKQKDRKDAAETVTKKTSWGWLLGSEEKEKDRERKEKEKEEKEAAKKAKSKQAKGVDKAHDSTRLDVLQTATDGSPGRESMVLDREAVKLEDDRRKDHSRKSAGDSRKESSLFSSLFGGKKKAEKEGSSRKPNRGLSPEPPPRILRADIDYNWTRFSILEERAIYRMAHIKLANPRRALYSQVLLSNFMYSYLAKVQQMHPSIQIPDFIQQKSQKREDQKDENQSDEFSQWQRYQEQHERNSSLYDGSSDTMTTNTTMTDVPGTNYADDFDPNHQQAQDSRTQHPLNGNNAYYAESQPWAQQDPYVQSGLFDDPSPSEESEMW